MKYEDHCCLDTGLSFMWWIISCPIWICTASCPSGSLDLASLTPTLRCSQLHNYTAAELWILQSPFTWFTPVSPFLIAASIPSLIEVSNNLNSKSNYIFAVYQQSQNDGPPPLSPTMFDFVPPKIFKDGVITAGWLFLTVPNFIEMTYEIYMKVVERPWLWEAIVHWLSALSSLPSQMLQWQITTLLWRATEKYLEGIGGSEGDEIVCIMTEMSRFGKWCAVRRWCCWFFTSMTNFLRAEWRRRLMNVNTA